MLVDIAKLYLHSQAYQITFMDPVEFKFIQLLIVEITGIVIVLAGIAMILLGLSGKVNLFAKGPGFSIRLANASPGLVITIIGAALIYYSVSKSTVTQKTTDNTSSVDRTEVLDEWLINCSTIIGNENYPDRITKILGDETDKRFNVQRYFTKHQETLGKVAENMYGDSKYWKLVAAPNLDRGYFDWPKALSSTLLPDSSFLEIWQVSKFNNQKTETIIQVKGIRKSAIYDDWLGMADTQPDYKPQNHFAEWSYNYRGEEMSLLLTPANYEGGIETYGELSLKYYGDKKYWKLIKWINPTELKEIFSGNDKIDKTKEIYLIHFIN